MHNYSISIEFMDYIDSKNTHGRKTVLTKLNELGLKNTALYNAVEQVSTNIGKNQLKFIWLDSFIAKLKD